MTKVRDERTKDEFIKFLRKHPSLRFGQALTAFLEANVFIQDNLSQDYLDIFHMEFDDLLYVDKKGGKNE